MSERTVAVYDLDGTLFNLNSTFDFILLFQNKKRRFFLVALFRIIRRLVNIFISDFYKRRNIYIWFLLIGVDFEELKNFYYEFYELLLFKNITPFGRRVIESNSDIIIVSGCLSIPGEWIAKSLKVSEYYFTALEPCCGSYIVKSDTCKKFKAGYLEMISKQYRCKVKYFTDDEEEIALLSSKQCSVVLVKNGKDEWI